MERRFVVGDSEQTVRIESQADGYRIAVGDCVYTVLIRRAANGRLTLDIDGRPFRAVVASDGTRRWVAVSGAIHMLELASGRGARRAAASASDLTAGMPGQVVSVSVSEGDHVERGQTLVVLEAMKMEMRVAAPRAGRVRSVRVSPGQVVTRGELLVELADLDSPD